MASALPAANRSGLEGFQPVFDQSLVRRHFRSSQIAGVATVEMMSAGVSPGIAPLAEFRLPRWSRNIPAKVPRMQVSRSKPTSTIVIQLVIESLVKRLFILSYIC